MKVAVGLSGGVDSTVAALLVRAAGDEVVGVTMTLGRADEEKNLAEARAAAVRIGIPLFTCNLAADWTHAVTDYIRTSYLAGRTPNPCVRCNERIKLGLLPRFALDTLGCDAFATGHYAQTVRTPDGLRLRRAADGTKDQSYFLYRVAPDILARTRFPLGALTKTEVRERARAFGLDVAERPDSQDFCGGDVRTLLGRPPQPGKIVTRSGRVIGEHAGYWNYTVGQRKGLGVGGGTPFYVIRLDALRNEVIVDGRDGAFAKSFSVTDVVGMAPLPDRCRVKVRSAGQMHDDVHLTRTGSGIDVSVPDGILGVAPGQSAVFYSGDVVLGGGIIASAT